MSNKKTTSPSRFQPKFHVKTGDTVVVTSGNHKGERGKILKIYTDKSRAIVEGVNIITKHIKPSARNPQGEIVKTEGTIHLSNLMVADPKTGKPTRIGRKIVNGKSVRYAKKSGEILS